MANISDDDADVIDINQLGFFHLCCNIDKEKQTEETRKQYDYYIKRHELMKKTLQDLNVPLTEAQCLDNTIAVYLFQIKGREAEAKQYLQEAMARSDTNGLNTISNLIYIYKHLENGQTKYVSEIEALECQLKTCLANSGAPQESARAMCERGWFYEFKIKENMQRRRLALYEKATNFIIVGIEIGTEAGMSQVELCIWKYALVCAHNNTFEFVADDSMHSIESKQNIFEAFAESFEKFYASAPDECIFYKSRVICDVLQKMTIFEEVLNTLPKFKVICQQGIIAEMWKNRVAAMEEAHSMSPNDFKIPSAIGKFYSRLRKFEEAEKYLHISLSLESRNNIGAMSVMLTTLATKAKVLETKHGNSNDVQDCLHQAYDWGKQLETIGMPGTSKPEMARVCYQLALDKTTNTWFVPQNKQKIIAEAIHYNKLSLAIQFGYSKARALRQLGDCFWVIKDYKPALEHFSKSLKKSSSNYMTLTLKLLLKNSSLYLNMTKVGDTEKHELVLNLSQDIQFAWDNITTHDAIIQICIDFAKHVLLSHYNIINILEEIRNRNGESGKELVKWYCQIIEENKFPLWLKNKCRTMREDCSKVVCVYSRAGQMIEENKFPLRLKNKCRTMREDCSVVCVYSRDEV